MAIAFDAAGSGTEQVDDSPATSPLEWTHTPVGTPRAVVVHLPCGGVNTNVVITGVTYGGVALSEVTGSPLNRATGEPSHVSTWFLGASIPTGAQTVSVAYTVATAGPELAGVSLTYTAGDDCSVVDTDVTISSDSQSDPSATLSLGGVSCACSIGFTTGQGAVGGFAPLSGWTSRGEFDFGAKGAGVYTYDTVGTSDVTVGWTQTADDAVAIAIAIREGGASLPEIEGDLDATEAVDTAAFSGTVLVQGDLAASETADTAAFAGTVLVQGDLDATESPDVAAYSGVVLIDGDLAATESPDVAAFDGEVEPLPVINGIQYVGGIAGSNTNGGDVTLDLTALTGGMGSAAIEGDLVVVSGGISDDSAGGGVTGWDEWFRYDGVAVSADLTFVVSAKFMTSTPDTSVTGLGNGNAGDSAAYTARVYRGVDATSPRDATITSATGTSTNPDSPSITPVTFGAWVISAALANNNDATITLPAGYSDQLNANADDSRDATSASAHFGAVVGDIARNPPSWTTWSSSEWCAVTIALRPAVSPLLAFVNSSSSSLSATITIPSDAEVGDLAVLSDRAVNVLADGVPTDVIPTNWSGIVTDDLSSAFLATRARSSYKIIGAGEPGSSVTGMAVSADSSKIMAVFRHNGPPVTSVAVQDIESELTDGNPSSKTVNASAGSEPLIAVALYGAFFSSAIAPTFTVSGSWSRDGRANQSNQHAAIWRFFDAVGQDVSVDAADTGDSNGIQAFYIEIGTGDNEGVLAATEAPDVAAITGQLTLLGNLAATEAPDTVAFDILLGRLGDIAATEAADVAAFNGIVLVQGDLDASEAADTASFTSIISLVADLAASEAPDVAAFLAIFGIWTKASAAGGVWTVEPASSATWVSAPTAGGVWTAVGTAGGTWTPAPEPETDWTPE